MKYFTLLLVILSVFSCEGRLRGSSRRLGFVQNGWNRHNNAAIKYGPQVINAVNKWGPAVKHCVGGLCGFDTMEDDEENVGGFVQNGWNRHNNAAIKYGPQVINAVNKWGPAVKHCVGGLCGLDTMEDDEEDVGTLQRVAPKLQSTCPPGEVYSSCHSMCPKTCKNRFRLEMCQQACRAGCDCVRGYVRDTRTNKCIPSSYCPRLPVPNRPRLPVPNRPGRPRPGYECKVQ